jgi:hypothetical protein
MHTLHNIPVLSSLLQVTHLMDHDGAVTRTGAVRRASGTQYLHRPGLGATGLAVLPQVMALSSDSIATVTVTGCGVGHADL